MLLHILAHINACHGILAVKQIFRKSLGKLRLADTGRAKKKERTYRAARVIQSGARTPDGIGHCLYGIVLPYHTLMKFLFKMQELFLVALCHLLYRYSCPTAHDFSNVFRIHLLLNHGTFALKVFKTSLNLLVLIFFRLDFGISYFGHFGIVAFTFCSVGFYLQLLDVNLVLLNSIDFGLFGLPFGPQGFFRIAQIGKVFVNLFQTEAVSFTLQSFPLDFKLLDFTRSLIESLRHRVHFKTQL